MPMVVPNIPKAPGRSAPVNRFWISPEFCGVSRPAARPCGSSRATTNSWIVGAASAAALHTTNAASAIRNIRRRA
jgi:hypothetical protein